MKLLPIALFFAITPLFAQDELEPQATPVDLTVREAAIFKDGHAFILAEAQVPAKSGWYSTLSVPEAILGTLWVTSGHPKAKVEIVRAGFEVAEEKTPCMTLAQTIECALNKEVALTILDAGTQTRQLEGTIVEIPKHELPREVAEAPPVVAFGDTVHVKTPSGTEVVRKSAIVAVKFKADFPMTTTTKIVRRRILVKLSVAADAGVEKIPLRFVYVQEGLRWIPEYRVELVGDKKARVELQATIVNDLADLRDANTYLVVGIPNFMMGGTLSPMALREVASGLSGQFDRNSRFNSMSNSIRSQVASYGEGRAVAAPAPGVDKIGKATSAEEYFLYAVPHISLKKGERATVPVNDGTYSYDDVYTLSIAPSAPRFVASNRNDELEAQLKAPKVEHGLKLANTGANPWTTGPAMIVKEGRALSQGILRFTPSGGSTILQLAQSPEIAVRIHDIETGRSENVRVNNHDYIQVFMRGTVCLVNHRKTPMSVDVERMFFGQAEKVGNDGKSEAFDWATFGQDSMYENRWQWPYWWHTVNGMFQATWSVKLEPGKSTEVTVEWSYLHQ